MYANSKRKKNVIGNNYRTKIPYPLNKSPNRLSDNHDIMNNSIGLIAVTAVALLLITATGMAQGVFASSHHHSHHHSHHNGHGHGHGSSSNSQSIAQANSLRKRIWILERKMSESCISSSRKW